MTLPRFLLFAVLLVLAAPVSAAVRLVEVMAAPFEGLHTRLEVSVYLNRSGEAVDLRLFEMTEAGPREVACWRVADGAEQTSGGACPSLPDGELAGGTVVVEVLRSLPLARYRVDATGEDGAVEDGEVFDTLKFPCVVARRLARNRSDRVPVFLGPARGDPEDFDGVSGVRRVEVTARAEGLGVEVEPASASGAGFVFDLLGADGLVWTRTLPPSPAMVATLTESIRYPVNGYGSARNDQIRSATSPHSLPRRARGPERLGGLLCPQIVDGPEVSRLAK